MDTTIDFSQAPFGLPSTHPKANEVNQLLAHSFQLQKITENTNACYYVNVALVRCLKAIGINVKLVFGIRTPGNVPHVWLNVDGHVIDNTFVRDISEAHFVSLKRSSTYIDEVPDEDDSSLLLSNAHSTSLGFEPFNVKHAKWLLENQDKAVAMSVNGDATVSYYNAMFMFVRTQHGVEVGKFQPCDTQCWSCNQEPHAGVLKTCTRCKVAKYCNKICQRNDWREIHKIACFPSPIY